MKKLILICMMFSTVMNYAADKTTTLKPNSELMTSWQFKTTYLSNGKKCYTEVDNYYFYSDNTCMKESNSSNCNSTKLDKKMVLQRWIIIGNNIVLLNDKGKQTAIFGIKGNISDMFKGQKIIAQTKELSNPIINNQNNDLLAMNK